jgi:hypothetical protein
MAKRAKNRKTRDVYVSAREGKELENRFRDLDEALKETIKSQRKSADELELALKRAVQKFSYFWYDGGGGILRRK